MSNGIGKNPLNDISRVYLQQVSERKKDDTYLEPDMKKRQANNEKAIKDMKKMGTSMKNPHFEEKQQGWDTVNSLTGAFKAMQEGIRDEDPEKGTAERKARLEKKRGMKMDDHPQYQKEGYGAPGHNPGSGEKSVARAKALMDRQGRKGAPGLDAMAAAKKEHEARRGVKKEEVEVDEAMSNYDRARKRAAERAAARNAARDAGKTGVVPGVGYVTPRRERETYVDSAGTTRHKSGAKMEGLDPVGKEDGDVNNDGKKDSTDSYLMKRRKAIGSAMKKRLKEERASLSEVMTDKEDDKKVTEKKVDNKITINPKLSEAVEEIGGEVLEMVEVEEMMDPKETEEKSPDISSKERRLQQVKKQIAMKKLQAIRQGDSNVMSSHEPEGDMIDERTRYAKETGKDFTTGKPSERGGTRPGNTFDKVKSELRKTGGVMSDRGKAIQPQGKKKVPGKKGYQGTTPVDRIKNRLAQQRAAKPNPYRARAGESD